MNDPSLMSMWRTPPRDYRRTRRGFTSWSMAGWWAEWNGWITTHEMWTVIAVGNTALHNYPAAVGAIIERERNRQDEVGWPETR